MDAQYLTFTLDNTRYAAAVGSVQEVLEYETPQVLPCSDPVISGIMRSRGKSIAVVNMRRKFGLPDAAPDGATKIIVFEVHDASHDALHNASLETTTYLGAITDSVQEVIEIPADKIEPSPAAVNGMKESKMIKGVSGKGNQFIIILDIEQLFSQDELSTILSLSNIKAEE